MAAPPADEQQDRERAIVEEAVAALRGEPAAATDHAAARHRVRVVLDAIAEAG